MVYSLATYQYDRNKLSEDKGLLLFLLSLGDVGSKVKSVVHVIKVFWGIM